MKYSLTLQQIESYRENGFLLAENFLTTDGLSLWRESVAEAIEQRDERKFANSDSKIGEDDGINKDSDFSSEVFDQMLNPLANK